MTALFLRNRDFDGRSQINPKNTSVYTDFTISQKIGKGLEKGSSENYWG